MRGSQANNGVKNLHVGISNSESEQAGGVVECREVEVGRELGAADRYTSAAGTTREQEGARQQPFGPMAAVIAFANKTKQLHPRSVIDDWLWLPTLAGSEGEEESYFGGEEE